MNKKAEKILNTTISLFIKEGVKKVTMDDISENAKSSKVTVYKYFTDKDTLYFEVGKFILQKYSQELKSIILSSDALIIKMQECLADLCEFADSGHQALCKELMQYNIDLRNEYSSYLQNYQDTMFALIDQGIEQKQIKSGLDRMLIFTYIDMGLEYYQNNASYRNKINNDKVFQESYMSFYIGNIFEKPVPY